MSPQLLRIALALVLLLALAPLPGPRAQGGNVGFVQLRLNVDATIPYFPAYIDAAENPFLEFNELTRLLEIGIRFDAALGSASGFLPDDGARFDLNLERMTVQIGSAVRPIPPQAVHLADNKLYVHWRELPQWFPIDIDWSLAAFQLSVATRFPLPSAELKERRAQRRLLVQGRVEQERVELYEPPVPWFDPGLVAFNLSASTGNEDPTIGALRVDGVHGFLQGDLSYGLTAPYNSEVPVEHTLDYVRLQYYDPLKTWEATLGDTYLTFSPLVLELAGFRGAAFYTGGRRLRYGRTSLVGTAPVGSEVDLYRLGILVDFTTADATGSYRFANVPLTQRSTVFEVRIFTPDGRTQVQYQTVSAQEDMVPPGRWATQGGGGHAVAEHNPFDVSGAEVRYGLFEPLTLGAYVVDLRNYAVDNGDPIQRMQAVAAFAIARPIDALTLQFEQAQDNETPGSGTRFNVFAGFELASLELEQRRYAGDFAPPVRTRAVQFTAPALLRTATDTILRTQLLATNLTLGYALGDYGQERRQTTLDARMDRRLFADLSGTLSWEQVRYAEPGQRVLGTDTAEAQLIYRVDLLSRAEFSYRQAQPTVGAASALARLAYQKTVSTASRWFYSASYIQATDQDNTAVAGAGYLFANNIRLSGQVDSAGAWVVAASYGVTTRLSDEGLRTFAPELYPRAGLTGAVFLDANGDGVLQPDEETLPGVKIKAPGVDNVVSGPDGRFQGWGLPSDEPVNISVDLLSVDALFIPARDHLLVATRPGQMLTLDIPLAPAGGLDGAVATERRELQSPLSGLELVLQEERGAGISTTLVEWDGSFILEGIRPGDYVLFANPEELRSIGYRLEPERVRLRFAAGYTPSWHSGVQLVAKPVAAAGSQPPGRR
ncbi:MAG: hypothetical protein HY342_05490 [Candidatus Lambdaproteobacteria bacterium]|nr:hypothetical protein [Candidatus Lambdaproteobacteria bacterium]